MSDRLNILDRVLAFIDRPWKALVVIVLVLVIGAGWFFWEKRAEIADALLRSQVHPELLVTRFKDVGLQLLKETDADAVMLMRGNLNLNTATDIEGYDRSERPWIALTGTRPIFAPESSVEAIIRFLANEATCYDVTDGGPEMRAEERLGIKRACIVAIPPLPHALVGALWLGWKTPLSVHDEAHAQVRMHDLSSGLATW